MKGGGVPMELLKHAWDMKLPEPLDQDVQKEYIAHLIRQDSDHQQYANLLIYHNLRLVTFTLKKYYPFWRKEFPELISVGVEAFSKCVYSYGKLKDPTLPFGTYCINRIRSSMGNYLHKEVSLINRSTSLEVEMNPNRSNSDSLENRTNDMHSSTLTLIENYEQKEEHETIKILVEQLPEPKKMIVKMHFGFNEEGRVFRQQEIAAHLHVGQPAVSKMLQRTLVELKMKLEESELGTQELQKRKMKKR